MTPEDLRNRFTYRPPDEDRRRRHEMTRAACLILADTLNNALPEGREKSLAITNLEQVMFWGNAAIARQQDDDGEGK